VRRELGLPTLFNLLGPLSNPAGVDRQLIGVGTEAAFEHYPEALRMLGARRALVVRGEWGMDELTPFGLNRLRELDEEGRIIDIELPAAALGLGAMDPDELRAPASREENAKLFRTVLGGKDKGTRRAAVALNAGAGLYIAGRAATIREGMARAEALIEEGAAIALLDRWIAG
jgi:anthranilate phosphoribosyltransferase